MAQSAQEQSVSGESSENARVLLGLLESVERDGAKSQRRLASELGIALGLGCAYLITSISPTLDATVGGGGAGGPGGFGGPARRAAGDAVEIALQAPVSVNTIVLAVVLAVAGGLIAGTFGGWRASRLRPADALRRVE